MKGLWARFKEGLARTREGLAGRLWELVRGRTKLDEDLWAELEAILLQADFGLETTQWLLEEVRSRARQEGGGDAEAVYRWVRESLLTALGPPAPLARAERGVTVVLLVGVNGVGKTTTAARLAYLLHREGCRVLLAAADTYRAAAIEQLQIWGQRVGAPVIQHEPGGDPAAVVFDAIQAAQARSVDYVLVDTAGRLHTKFNLMEELKKIRRVAERALPGAPQEVLLVLDAGIGQNALAQARAFHQAVGVTGLVLTKLDGTARGGIVAAAARELGVPVKFVGLGEGPDDLRPFDPAAFVEAALPPLTAAGE
ncbi:MAG: signal recognition particle-docking protein FtsY [Bacillota bacterium]|nr:signal recognition particle-docking protein FtsY [Bacillota bacterium]